MTSTKILTIILNWNGKADTLACLESLGASSPILVVDNGSTDDSVTAIRSGFPHVFLLETGENLGYAGGNNAGIEWGLKKSFENFLLLNNDTLVARTTIEKFSEALTKLPQVGIFGAKVYLQSDPKRLDHLGGNWNFRNNQMDLVGLRALDDGKSFEEPLPIDYVCGAAMLVRRSVFEKIGLLDPRFFLYWEDTDLCFRAKRAGFGVEVYPAAQIWHKVSATASKAGKPFTSYFFWRNSLLWLERNRPWNERFIGYLRALFSLIKEYPKMLLKRLKIRLLPDQAEERKKLLLQQRARLFGYKDYFLRKFGKGSSSLFKA